MQKAAFNAAFLMPKIYLLPITYYLLPITYYLIHSLSGVSN